jgi:pimeloyl-ACP methyl ester carboxylesterase
MKNQAIVILGGFLSNAAIYRGMGRTVHQISGRPVWLVETQAIEWLATTSQAGWSLILNRLSRTVEQAFRSSNQCRVTVIGHSMGGVLARLYLSPQPFRSRNYNGLERVDRLITLGSPHYNRGGWRRGGSLSRWIEERYPGAYFAPEVEYISAAGRWMCGTQLGPHLAAWVYREYQAIGGDGTARGDGLIPMESALLNGSHQIILPGVCHFGFFDQPWYGSPEVIPRWWNTPEFN